MVDKELYITDQMKDSRVDRKLATEMWEVYKETSTGKLKIAFKEAKIAIVRLLKETINNG